MKIKCVNFGGEGANCYLVQTEDALIVIDPFDVNDKIAEFLSSNLPKFVLLTHCHYDHILGAKRLRDTYGAKIAIGEHDELGLRDPYFSLASLAGYNQEPFCADILFSDKEIFKIGATEILVLHTAGHTAGSVCYVMGDYIFTGDTLFEGTVGRTDFPTGNTTELMASIQKIKNLGKDYKLFCGHGLATTLSRELKMNPYL